jgi:hypothetical protein
MKSTHHTHDGRRGVLGAIAITAIVLALAGCGGSSPSGGVAHLGSSTGSSSTSTASASSSEDPASIQKAMVAYARCMRSHGVPGFPEPTEGHIEIHSQGRSGGPSTSNVGINPEGAAFQAADKTCRKLLPNGGTPSPQQQAKAAEGALAFSRCMRSHGVPNFPSPQISAGRIALKLGGPNSGIDPQSPQFQKAQKACQSNLGPPGGKGGPGGNVTAVAP